MQHDTQFECGKFSVVGPVKGQAGILGHKRLLCSCYRCRICLPRLLRRARARIAQLAEEHQLKRLATLTLDPSKIPAGVRSDRYIRDCWRKMRVGLARRFGGSVKFIAVLEFQRSGIAHLHALLGIYIPQGWLSEAWQAIGGGEIVDIRCVDVNRVAGYLATYLTGQKVVLTLSLLPRRARIFSCSRSISLWGKKEQTLWWLVKRRVDFLYGRGVNVKNERFEPIEDLKPFDLELLMSFEGSPTQVAKGELDTFQVLRALASAAKG